jgi:hypothetical protein
MISLSELLEIKEFKYCPYKKFLPYAFDIEQKNQLESTNIVHLLFLIT